MIQSGVSPYRISFSSVSSSRKDCLSQAGQVQHPFGQSRTSATGGCRHMGWNQFRQREHSSSASTSPHASQTLSVLPLASGTALSCRSFTRRSSSEGTGRDSLSSSMTALAACPRRRLRAQAAIASKRSSLVSRSFGSSMMMSSALHHDVV